jgi:hypothetical protein
MSFYEMDLLEVQGIVFLVNRLLVMRIKYENYG